MNNQPNYNNLDIILDAADHVAAKFAEVTLDKGSNGSEAWQAVQIKTKGNIKLQNALKKLGFKKDGYWGYTTSALKNGYSGFGYYKDEAYTTALASELTKRGIPAMRVERLL
jgi:hypothetical protein